MCQAQRETVWHPFARLCHVGRPVRSDVPGGYYHVVNRGVARNDIFFDDCDRVEFTRLLGVVHERFGVDIHAFALMTNHYHLLLECPEGTLSDAMHLLGSVFVRHTNVRVGRDGPMFRDRFYAKPVMSDDYLIRLVRYIHRNPVAIVGEEHLADYRWSSLRSHLQLRQPPNWLRTELVGELFGGAAGVASSTLGGTDPGAQVTDADDLVALIELMVDEHLGDRARQGAARSVAVLLLDRLPTEAAKALSEWLDFSTANAERVARSKVKRRVGAEPSLTDVADAVVQFLAD